MEDATKQMTLQEMHDWVFDDLGFCGCGDPEGALELLQNVLTVIRTRSNRNHEIEDDRESAKSWSDCSNQLDVLIGYKERPALAWSYLYRLSDLDLMEHGGNCRDSWLTERGEQILDALIKYDAGDVIEGAEDEILEVAP